MPAPRDRVPHLHGVHPIPPGIRVGEHDPHERFDVTIRVRPRASSKRRPSPGELCASPLGDRRYLSREEFEEAYGGDPKDLGTVQAFAAAHGLTVVGTDAARRAVVVSGTAAAHSDAFGVRIARYRGPRGSFRGHTGRVHVTKDVAPIIEGVFGFDDRPHGERRAWHPKGDGTSYTVPELARIYDFPKDKSGKGQCIALLEFGGGYRTSDLAKYFGQLRIPVPDISTVEIGAARNNPDDARYPKEVTLDIAVAGAIAPEARIVIYFAPLTEAGWLEAITRAVHDKSHRPSVISISWGAPETQWTEDVRQHIEQVFEEAAAMGVTICCSSGDTGSGGGLHDHRAHVYFPASSPFVLACGGTKIESFGENIREVVWEGDLGEASSGGVSEVFLRPSWQEHACVPPSVNHGAIKGRGVPDVAANASHYCLVVDGEDTHGGGTSAAAPLWAGLIALINEHLAKPAGHLNPVIYGSVAARDTFRDIVHGYNGAYEARRGWDACTGLGTPHGINLMRTLAQLAG